MNLAKVPNSDESHWESLDIFLFRNGEHATPPRKYHIKYEDLDNWQNILKTIAQNQYGTTQSVVDLYTIDGAKVTTPIEITNNNFYVTVPPHDKFNQAGYKEYVLKASRSREKRLGKFGKPNNDTTLAETEEKNKQPKSDATGRTNVPVETRPTSQPKSGQILNRRGPNISPLSKKNNSNIPPATVTKVPLKRTEYQPRKNPKMSTEKFVSKDRIAMNVSDAMKSKNKEINKIGKFNSLITPSNEIDNNTRIYNETIIDENSITTESPTVDNVICDKELIVVKNPDSIALESSKGASLLTRPIVNLSDIPILPLLEESKENKENTADITDINAEEIKKPDVVVFEALTGIKKEEVNDNVLIENSGPQDPYNSTEINESRSKNNVIAIIDKGDIVAFNLKLELKKCDGIIRTQYDTFEKVQSLTENQPQKKDFVTHSLDTTNDMPVDECLARNAKLIIVQCSCCGHENYDQILDEIEIPANTERKKYVVVVPNADYKTNFQRCCCEQETPKEYEMDVNTLSAVNYVKKVYANTSITKLTSREKAEIGTQINDDKSFQTQSMSRNNSNTKTSTTSKLKKTEKERAQSDTEVEIFQVNDIKTLQTESISRNNSNIKIGNTSVIKKTAREKPEADTEIEMHVNDVNALQIQSILRNNSNMKLSKHSILRDNQINLQPNPADAKNTIYSKDIAYIKTPTNSVQLNIPELEVQKTETVILGRNTANMTTQCVDASTQTEWSSLLLEVKRHEDGRYSFHIPPLSVLKYYFW